MLRDYLLRECLDCRNGIGVWKCGKKYQVGRLAGLIKTRQI